MLNPYVLNRGGVWDRFVRWLLTRLIVRLVAIRRVRMVVSLMVVRVSEVCRRVLILICRTLLVLIRYSCTLLRVRL